MPIIRFYTEDAVDAAQKDHVLKQLKAASQNIAVAGLNIETCYHVETSTPITAASKDAAILCWLLKHPQHSADFLKLTTQLNECDNTILIEIGPRFNFSTAFSTNCVNICQNVGLKQVQRLEVSQRYLISFQQQHQQQLNDNRVVIIEKFVDVLSDRMTECIYTTANLPIKSFNEQLPKSVSSWYYVPILAEGRKALEEVNGKLGLAFGDWDLDYYTELFKNVLKRDPTTVELFDCAQSNSEHSRHWFFRGKIIVDGEVQPRSLIRMIMDTQLNTNPNNTIKFSDNSSAIEGFTHTMIRPRNFDTCGVVNVSTVESDLIFTAETHNMPTAVAPFSGATTGTGGRLRDVQGVGRGGLPIAGTAGYCVGCLNIPDYAQPYENANYAYPTSFTKPLKVLIEASNGASDYGNKFGEPLIAGFVCSYGLTNAAGERDEYVKPIMFSGGLGTMDARMREKIDPKRGMLLAKIGGPVYRIGVGGGAASSVEVQGSNDAELDFNAVQRGDAEMENKLNRVVRACIEMGDKNPILAIHDQGAGGNGNVLKELVEPGFAGAVIFSKEFQLGDPTINALELWGAEYQENNAILCHPEDRELIERICARERCPISFVGVVTGNGRVTLLEAAAPGASNNFEAILQINDKDYSKLGPMPFDLELKHVLGDMPKREYQLERLIEKLLPLRFDSKLDIGESLERVLSLVSVGSKRFLTNKVDRCVSGLIAQQQCVGPLHTPLADFGLVTISHFQDMGIATSIGTQPIKGLLNATAMARMCVAEALTNLVFVKITEMADIKCSGNWMWAAKLPGEGAKLFDACQEMCEMMKELHIAVDGGKDSLSMAAKVGDKIVKSPGTLVISTYAPCPDVRVKITPDLKGPLCSYETSLLWINIEGKFRLGASALAQAYGQQGVECPTVMRTIVLRNAFNVTQELLQQQKLLAGHDISDGGLLVCIVEMALAGLAGVHIDLTDVLKCISQENIDNTALRVEQPEMAILYAEECGWLLEVETSLLKEVQAAFAHAHVPTYCIGYTIDNREIIITSGAGEKKRQLLRSNVETLYKQWERTSFELEKLQANPDCALSEYNILNKLKHPGPQYHCTASLKSELVSKFLLDQQKVRVAVLREEGINSDREMMYCLFTANFEVHDVTMSDLLSGKTTLERYRGVIFPGGFSYADTLGSAKGWAANIMFSELLAPQFQAFKARQDVFSLGICNGCQLMCLIGWVGDNNNNVIKQTEQQQQQQQQQQQIDLEIPNVALLHNKSQRFECRWSTVHIPQNKSIMLQNLTNSTLGCWIAHGEGRFSFRTDEILQNLKQQQCVALQYVDDCGEPTMYYPMNPNGSIDGIAGLCSADGRHLALMPHPERCSRMSQWPYVSPNFNVATTISPWQLMFNNAYDWCTKAKQ